MAKDSEYSTGVSPEQHAELLSSADAREQRQAEKRAALEVVLGSMPRGRKRPDLSLLLPPNPLPKDEIRSLGERLLARGTVLKSKFTRGARVFFDRSEYDAYTQAPIYKSGRVETDPEELVQAQMARERQPLNVRDNLHGNIIDQLRMAMLFEAGLESVRYSLTDGVRPGEEALLVSASAIEDFGFSLEEDGIVRKMRRGGSIARNLQATGQYAAKQPGILLAQDPLLFLLVQREQERRTELYGAALERYEQPDWGGDRRTEAQIIAIAQTEAVIRNLQVQ